MGLGTWYVRRCSAEVVTVPGNALGVMYLPGNWRALPIVRTLAELFFTEDAQRAEPHLNPGGKVGAGRVGVDVIALP